VSSTNKGNSSTLRHQFFWDVTVRHCIFGSRRFATASLAKYFEVTSL